MSEHPVDLILAPLGFEVWKVKYAMRRYRGNYKGRCIQVEIRPQRLLYRRAPGPPIKEYSEFCISVDTPDLKTYAAFGKEVAFWYWPGNGRNEIILNDPAYADWLAFSDAPNWGSVLMNHPTAKSLILRLNEGGLSSIEAPMLAIEFGCFEVWDVVDSSELTIDYVRQRMDDLLALVSIAESLPLIDHELERVHVEVMHPSSDRQCQFYCCLFTIFLGVIFGLVSWLIFSLIERLF